MDDERRAFLEVVATGGEQQVEIKLGSGKLCAGFCLNIGYLFIAARNIGIGDLTGDRAKIPFWGCNLRRLWWESETKNQKFRSVSVMIFIIL